jgi:hypothetical protein
MGSGTGALSRETLEQGVALGRAALVEFTRRWPARPLAHSTAAGRVAALYESLGMSAADAAQRAMHLADLVNEHVFRPYWRG